MKRKEESSHVKAHVRLSDKTSIAVVDSSPTQQHVNPHIIQRYSRELVRGHIVMPMMTEQAHLRARLITMTLSSAPLLLLCNNHPSRFPFSTN